jgi:hypothetical protein
MSNKDDNATDRGYCGFCNGTRPGCKCPVIQCATAGCTNKSNEGGFHTNDKNVPLCGPCFFAEQQGFTPDSRWPNRRPPDGVYPLDQNVADIIAEYTKRAEHGRAKYGVTTERRDIDLVGWLQHLKEELMDATIYIQRTIKEVKERDDCRF